MAQCPKCGSDKVYVLSKIEDGDGFVRYHYHCKGVGGGTICGYEWDEKPALKTVESMIAKAVKAKEK